MVIQHKLGLDITEGKRNRERLGGKMENVNWGNIYREAHPLPDHLLVRIKHSQG